MSISLIQIFMKEKKFLDTISDDILMVEDAYMAYIEKCPNTPSHWIWSSLCRIYSMISVSEIEFFIEYVMEKAKMKKEKNGDRKLKNL